MTFGQVLLSTVINPLLTIIWIVMLVYVVLSWLVGFNVVNPRNQLVSTIGRVTEALTAPLLNPIRRVLPTLGGMDFSPLIVLLIIFFLQGLIRPGIGPLWRALG
jgi:YggT family protein